MRRLLPFLLLSGCSTTCANGMCRQANGVPIIIVLLILFLIWSKKSDV